MRKIVLFCEDSGHDNFLTSFVSYFFSGDNVQIASLSAKHGKGKALSELEKYLKQVNKNLVPQPDAIIAAIDANCRGYNEKKREIDEKVPQEVKASIPIILAIPDPHVERWLLIDSHAFKKVFGAGCDTPRDKCEKNLYKKLLKDAIKRAGGETLLGGMEYSQDIVKNMDLKRTVNLDASLKKFAEELTNLRNFWKAEASSKDNN